MNDNSDKKLHSLSKFDFLPEWENKKIQIQDTKPKAIKKEKRHSSEHVIKQRTNLFKIDPFIPQKVVDEIKSKLRKDGITRPIYTIYKEIVDKNLFHVAIEWANNQKRFLKYKNDNKYFFSKIDAANDLIFHQNLLKLKVTDTITITTDFKNVLFCNKTSTIFPPTSHNLFNNIIDSHLLEQKICSSREKYINTLSQSSDSHHIGTIKNNKVEIKEFILPNNRSFHSLKGVLDEITKNTDQYFTEFEKIKIGMKQVLETKEYDLIKSEIKSNLQNIGRDIERVLNQILKRSKFHVFNTKKCKYVSAYQPNDVLTYKLSLRSEKVLGEINKSDGLTISVMLNNHQQLNMSKLDILKEIKWLIQIGMVRMFDSGKICLTKS